MGWRVVWFDVVPVTSTTKPTNPGLNHLYTPHIYLKHTQVVSVAEAFGGEHLSLHARVGMTTDAGHPPFCWADHPGAIRWSDCSLV